MNFSYQKSENFHFLKLLTDEMDPQKTKTKQLNVILKSNSNFL